MDTGKIIDYARSLGLSAGAADPGVFVRARRLLAEREAKGLETPFVSGDVDRRSSPRLIMPKARSLLSFALPYQKVESSPRQLPSTSSPVWGVISRSVSGPDYHKVLLAKIKETVSFMKSFYPRLQYYSQVDSGPLLEREAAARAGVGFFGYHNNIITPQWGSWVFLGGLLTNLELEATAFPLKECQKCRRCLQSCPTGALAAPYFLDASRCLSYLTQRKGYFPLQWRKKLGNRVYGCDTCQEVCPHNSWQETSIPPLKVDLLPLIKMTGSEFQEIFGPTAAAWRGRTVMQRNALLALGNTGSRECVPYLEPLLDDERPLIRAHAAWAISCLQDNSSPLLKKALERETDGQVRREMLGAFTKTT